MAERDDRGVLGKLLFSIFGPADLGPEHRRENPLRGTKWDPELKQARKGQARKGQGSKGQGKRGGTRPPSA